MSFPFLSSKPHALFENELHRSYISQVTYKKLTFLNNSLLATPSNLITNSFSFHWGSEVLIYQTSRKLVSSGEWRKKQKGRAEGQRNTESFPDEIRGPAVTLDVFLKAHQQRGSSGGLLHRTRCSAHRCPCLTASPWASLQDSSPLLGLEETPEPGPPSPPLPEAKKGLQGAPALTASTLQSEETCCWHSKQEQ